LTIQLADVVASVIVTTLGNGLLGTYLLQRYRGGAPPLKLVHSRRDDAPSPPDEEEKPE
jgi:hypothetical protein